MALPQLTKGGNAYTPFTFEKGRSLPANEPINPNQIAGVAGGNQVKVGDLGTKEELFHVRILRVSSTNKTNLLGFLADATVNYAQNTFTFVDEDANSHTVRLLMAGAGIPMVDVPKVSGGLYNISIWLRKEVT